MSGYLASFLASLDEDEPTPRPKRSKPVDIRSPANVAPEAVSPVSPSKNGGDTEKDQQNQDCITCITCITEKEVTHEQRGDEARTEKPFVIVEWRAAISAVRSDLPDIVKLRRDSLRFLDGPDALTAVDNDWDAISLFGMHEGRRPRERIDCWGLVLFLAWGVHRCTVETIGQKVCALRTRSGAVQTQPRLRANFDQAVPWWRHPGIMNTIEGHSDE